MKPNLTSFLLAAVLLSLAGCSSTPTRVDKGPIRAQTFQFVNPGRPLPSFAEREQSVHTQIQKAITDTLASQQVRRTEQGGEVTVAYLLITGNNAVTTSINDYFGYGRDASALVDKAHEKYTDSKNPNYFEAGTLLIDIVDSKTGKVLERGYVTRPLLKNPSPEQRAARIQEAVGEILKTVRFKQ